jgi:hypothetical protein
MNSKAKTIKRLLPLGVIIILTTVTFLGRYTITKKQQEITISTFFPQTSPTTVPILRSKYQQFSNPRYGYTLEYPITWKVQVWTTDSPPYPETNNQRIQFNSPDGEYVLLDTWDSTKGLSLSEWYEWHEVHFLTRTDPPGSPNTKIAGEEAFMTIDPSGAGVPATVTATFSKEGYIFRLEYTPMQEGTQVNVYRYILETLEFGKECTEDMMLEIPMEKLKLCDQPTC